jgi:hypothetical protein
MTESQLPRDSKPWPVYVALAYFGLFTAALCFTTAYCFSRVLAKGASENMDFVIVGSVCSLLIVAFIALITGLLSFTKGAFTTALIVLAVLSFLYVYGTLASPISFNAVYAAFSVFTFAALITDSRVRRLYKFGKGTTTP